MSFRFSKPTIAITRPESRAEVACNLVKEMGGKPYLAPTLSLKPVNSDSLQELIANIDSFDWIVFTSPTTFDAINKFYPNILNKLNTKIAVIGTKSKEIANNYNLEVDLIPDNYTAEGLVEEFKKQNIKNKKIAIPRTISARNTLENGLKELNNEVFIAEAYKSLTPENIEIIEKLIADLDNIDAITFTSPLTVENLFNTVNNKENLSYKLSNMLTVAIGPITSNKLKEYNVKNIYPSTYTVKDMLELLFNKWRG